MRKHSYQLEVVWTGDEGQGTLSAGAYTRDHEIRVASKPTVLASSDPAFRGNPQRHNPEELLVAALSSCHMLWYLSLCALSGVVVVGYADRARGVMVEESDGGGQFREVELRPTVTVAQSAMCETAKTLHRRANELCFIARSVNFPVRHQSRVKVQAS